MQMQNGETARRWMAWIELGLFLGPAAGASGSCTVHLYIISEQSIIWLYLSRCIMLELWLMARSIGSCHLWQIVWSLDMSCLYHNGREQKWMNSICSAWRVVIGYARISWVVDTHHRRDKRRKEAQNNNKNLERNHVKEEWSEIKPWWPRGGLPVNVFTKETFMWNSWMSI